MALRPNSTAPATLGSMIPRRQQQAITAYRRTPRGIEFNTLARYRGAAIGSVAMLIRDKENISIRVRDIIEIVRPMMPLQEYEALAGSSQSDQFVTLNRLRSSGIPVHFNQNDELVFGS